MEPLLSNGQKVLVDMNYYSNHSISRGDIVLVKFKTIDQPYIKRVAAIPGDIVEFGIEDNNSGRVVLVYPGCKEGCILSRQLEARNNTVPISTVILLGDNTKGSFDSVEFGLVSIENIIGKVLI